MKPAAFLTLLACLSFSTLCAEDKPIKIDKSTADQAKNLLEKAVSGLKSAAEKTEDKGRDLWARTKENLQLSREEYVKKVESGLRTMAAEIQVLAESESTLVSRDYFKTRLESLRQHLDYCKRDLDRLKASESEEAFRAKQKGFDRGLGYLGDHIELTQEEAGL